MYESRKNLGDVCKDVSSSIKERKNVLSEEQQHHRDSEPRPVEAEFHLSDTVRLGIEDDVIFAAIAKKIRERYIKYDPVIYFNRCEYFSELFQVQINMMISGKGCYFRILFDSEEIFNINMPIEDCIFQKVSCFVDEEMKKYI